MSSNLTYPNLPQATADDVPEPRSGPEPEPIKANLHEHQKDGLRWMVRMYDNGMPLVLVSCRPALVLLLYCTYCEWGRGGGMIACIPGSLFVRVCWLRA